MKHVTCCECGTDIEVRSRGALPKRCPPCHLDRKRALGRAYWENLPIEERRQKWVEAKRPRRMPPVGTYTIRPRQCADCGTEIRVPHGPQKYCGPCSANRETARNVKRKREAAKRKREALGKVAPVFSHPKVTDGEFLRRVAMAEAREREQEASRLARLTRRCDCGGLIGPGVRHECGRVA